MYELRTEEEIQVAKNALEKACTTLRSAWLQSQLDMRELMSKIAVLVRLMMQLKRRKPSQRMRSRNGFRSLITTASVRHHFRFFSILICYGIVSDEPGSTPPIGVYSGTPSKWLSKDIPSSDSDGDTCLRKPGQDVSPEVM